MDKKVMDDLGDFLVATGNYVKVAGGLIGDLFEPSPKKHTPKNEKKTKTIVHLLPEKGKHKQSN